MSRPIDKYIVRRAFKRAIRCGGRRKRQALDVARRFLLDGGNRSVMVRELGLSYKVALIGSRSIRENEVMRRRFFELGGMETRAEEAEELARLSREKRERGKEARRKRRQAEAVQEAA